MSAVFGNVGHLRVADPIAAFAVAEVKDSPAAERDAFNEKSTSVGDNDAEQAKLEKAIIDRVLHYKQVCERSGEAHMLLCLAECQRRCSKKSTSRRGQEKALVWAREAHALFADLGDAAMQAACSLELCAHYHTAKNASSLEQAAGAALAEARVCEDEEKIATALLYAAKAKTQLGAYIEALEEARGAREIFARIFMQQQEVEALCMMAECYVGTDRRESTAAVARQTLEILASMDDEGSQGDWDARICCSLVRFVAAASVPQAEQLAEIAMSRFRDKELPRKELLVLETMILLQQAKDKYATSHCYVNKALNLCREIGCGELHVKFLHLAAESLHHTGDFDGAEAQLNQASDAARASGDSFGLAVTLRMMSYLHLHQGHYAEASTAAAQSQAEFHKLGDKGGEGTAVLAEAFACLAWDEEASLVALCEARRLFQDAYDLSGEGDLLQIMSEIHCDGGRYCEAYSTVVECRSLRQELQDKRGEARAVHSMAGIQLYRDLPHEALELALEARRLARQAQDVRVELHAMLLLVQVYIVLDALDRSSLDCSTCTSMPSSDFLQAAIKTARDAIPLCNLLGDEALVGAAKFWQGRILMLGNRLEGAMRPAEEALTHFKAAEEKQGMAYALLLSAQLCTLLGQRMDAKEKAAEAVEVAAAAGDAYVEAAARELLLQLGKEATLQPAIASNLQQAEGETSEAKPMATLSKVHAETPTETGQVAEQPPQAAAKPAMSPEVLKASLLRMLGDLAVQDIASDSPLMAAGVDSLSSLSLSQMVKREFGIRTPATLVFEYPSVHTIVEYLVEESLASAG